MNSTEQRLHAERRRAADIWERMGYVDTLAGICKGDGMRREVVFECDGWGRVPSPEEDAVAFMVLLDHIRDKRWKLTMGMDPPSFTATLRRGDDDETYGDASSLQEAVVQAFMGEDWVIR